MKNSWIRYAITALSLAASAAFGNAFSGPNPDTRNLTWNGFSNGSVGVNVSTNGGTSYSGVNAGQFQGFFDGEGNGLGADDFFRFFCIDLAEYVASDPNLYTRTFGVPDPTNAAQLTRLFDHYYPNPATGIYYSGGAQTNFGDFANADDSAAFQLAVWEIWFDNDMNLSTGSFQATGGSSTVINQAQTELNFVLAGSGTPAGWALYEFTNQGKQDYLSVTHTGPLQQAPEPGTLILLGVGALAAWGSSKSSKRHRKTA